MRLARFKGTTKRDFIDNQQQEGDIFQLVDAAMSFFFKHLNLSGTTHNRLYRIDELEIPYDALRESIVNAYCHMNRGHEAATVGLAIYDDRIEIENAGRFPARISPDALLRNEEIQMQDRISRAELAAIAECSESTVKRRLKDWGIAWLGHPKTGHRVFVKEIR